MKCPVCGCLNFYIKDPNDEYETYDFELREGTVAFSPDAETSAAPGLQDKTETYCNKCSWHGKFMELTGAHL
jgi:hypothetical protein